MNYLIYTLFGALQSWGCITPGRMRPTDDHPTKSGAIGVIGCCKGIPRGDSQMDLLNQNLGFACRTDAPGVLYENYQTAQITGREECLEQMKHYLVEAAFTVCIWKKAVAGPDLEEIQQALRSPEITPSLGRWNCPLGLPLDPRIVQANDPVDALQKCSPPSMIPGLLKRTPVYWEGEASIKPVRSYTRRDQLVSNQKRSFRNRIEHMAVIERGQ